MYLLNISVLQFTKVFNRSLVFTFRKIFIHLSFDLQTVSLNCLANSWKLGETPMQVGGQISQHIPLLRHLHHYYYRFQKILPIFRNLQVVVALRKLQCQHQLMKLRWHLLVQDLVEYFIKHQSHSANPWMDHLR